MTPDELAIDGLASQEFDSLAACIARGQSPDSYQDIIEKIRGHLRNLPEHRREFWSQQCKALAIEIFAPSARPPKKKAGTVYAESGSSSNPTGERS